MELFDGIFSDSVQSILRYAGIGLVFYFLLMWFASIVWIIRDISNRTRDPISIFVALIIAVILPFVGLPIYFILRPSMTLSQSFESNLEQQILLTEIYNLDICSNLRCKKPLKDNWISCVYCGRVERALCPQPQCNTILSKKWIFCPKCGTSSRPAQEAQDASVLKSVKKPLNQSTKNFGLNLKSITKNFDFNFMKKQRQTSVNLNKKLDKLIKEKKDNNKIN
ncbi:MAG: hypothetical protein P8J51_06110 [Dehalococcoidia bacterium]|nr:hypothetical protein [Dehalococcoidia bacterium]